MNRRSFLKFVFVTIATLFAGKVKLPTLPTYDAAKSTIIINKPIWANGKYYDTINQAIDDNKPGITIYVLPGGYDRNPDFPPEIYGGKDDGKGSK